MKSQAHVRARSLSLGQARLSFKLRNQTRNLSKHTLTYYEQHLDRLADWCRAHHREDPAFDADPAVAALTTEHLRAFIAYLQGKDTTYDKHPLRFVRQSGLSPYTIRGVVATLSTFFAWAQGEGVIGRNPMEHIDRPKVPKQIKERFSDEDIERLLAACKMYPPSLQVRNEALVRFLLDTCVRAQELCTLTVAQIEIERGRARVTGKGAKDRYVYFGRTVRPVLNTYISIDRPASLHPELFLTVQGRPFTPDHLTKILHDLGERAQVPHTHPHRFRHTGARLLARNGLDAFMIQKVLGHEDLKTSRTYVELEHRDIERAYATASPGDRLGRDE